MCLLYSHADSWLGEPVANKEPDAFATTQQIPHSQNKVEKTA
jgi:hypothetical protein